jgi:kynurenine formamidase
MVSKPSGRRHYTRAEFDDIIHKCRNWGQWGPEDELGSANYVTEETVRTAAGLVRRGKVFSLSLPMDRTGPQPANATRVNPQHVMFRHGGDLLAVGDKAPQGLFTTDDAVYMPLQASTQWDAYPHVFFDGRTYNDQGPATVTGRGAAVGSITNFKDRAIGRGVLLDIARFFGRPFLEPREAIQDTDLEGCAQVQGVEVRTGDFVLVRTGHLGARLARGSWGDFVGGDAPGLGLSASQYLCARSITAAASDTWAVEVLPSETPDVKYPVHVAFLVNAGIHIGEMWVLDEFAADCAADRVYEFLLVAQPLTITGAVGSPINPLAVK